MHRQTTFTRTALAAGLLLACASAHADADVAALQQRLSRIEQEMSTLHVELAKVAAEAPAQEQKIADMAARVAKVETAPAPVPAAKQSDNRVFFRGGYAKLPDDRSNGAFTDMINLPGAIGLADINNNSEEARIAAKHATGSLSTPYYQPADCRLLVAQRPHPIHPLT